MEQLKDWRYSPAGGRRVENYQKVDGKLRDAVLRGCRWGVEVDLMDSALHIFISNLDRVRACTPCTKRSWE
jgi:hypothetical protein